MKIYFTYQKYPKIKIIGIEPFKNGVTNIADFCIKNNLKNIFLYPQVFHKFTEKFKNYHFNQCYIFFLILGLKKTSQKKIG